MLFDTMFARDMYQVYEINDDWLTWEYYLYVRRRGKVPQVKTKECKFQVPCAGETATCWVVAVIHTKEQNMAIAC